MNNDPFADRNKEVISDIKKSGKFNAYKSISGGESLDVVGYTGIFCSKLATLSDTETGRILSVDYNQIDNDRNRRNMSVPLNLAFDLVDHVRKHLPYVQIKEIGSDSKKIVNLRENFILLEKLSQYGSGFVF